MSGYNTFLIKFKKSSAPYLLISPALILVLGVLAYSVASGFVMSLFDIDLSKKGAPFVGLLNYIELFRNPAFINSLKKSLIFVLGCVSLGMLLSMIFALGIYRCKKHSNTFKAIGLVPYLVSGIATAVMFKFLFTRQIGVINTIMVYMGLESIPFLAHPNWALFVVILANTWFIVPFSMLIISAGMEGIDPDIYEASTVDGASGTSRFFRITLPLIMPMMGISLVWISLASFNMFDIILPLTNGGPGSATELMAVYMYRVGFKQFRYSMGSSIMVIILSFNIVLSILYLRVLKTSD